jgi:putative SOS response-associated peptidase YedK
MRRFTRYLRWSEIQPLYRLTADWERQRNNATRYNIAPTDPVPFLTVGENGDHKLREGRWWLVAWWAKDLPEVDIFNARIELLDTENTFESGSENSRSWFLRTAITEGQRALLTPAHLCIADRRTNQLFQSVARIAGLPAQPGHESMDRRSPLDV